MDIYIFLITSSSIVCILSFIGVYIINKSSQKQKNEEKENQSKLDKIKQDAKNYLSINNVKAVIKCKIISSLANVVQNTDCTIELNDNSLQIIAQTKPIHKFSIDLSQIVSFSLNTTNEVKKVYKTMYRLEAEEKITKNFLDLCFISSAKENKQLFFELNSSPENKAFNEVALQQSNIFDLVNAKINHQNTTIKL